MFKKKDNNKDEADAIGAGVMFIENGTTATIGSGYRCTMDERI